MEKSESPTQRSREVNLADEEGLKDILVRTVFGPWDIVNDLTRLRPSRRELPGDELRLRPARRWPTRKTLPSLAA